MPRVPIVGLLLAAACARGHRMPVRVAIRTVSTPLVSATARRTSLSSAVLRHLAPPVMSEQLAEAKHSARAAEEAGAVEQEALRGQVAEAEAHAQASGAGSDCAHGEGGTVAERAGRCVGGASAQVQMAESVEARAAEAEGSHRPR